MRTIELYLHPEFWSALAGHAKKVDNAVGYMSLWGISNERIKTVKIAPERAGCLQATYLDSDGALVFFLHAQWNESNGTYSFHS